MTSAWITVIAMVIILLAAMGAVEIVSDMLGPVSQALMGIEE